MIKENLKTINKSSGVNTKSYIILHHTASENVKGTISRFQNKDSGVSCHYIIDINGDIYSMENESTILWHCGVSEWLFQTSLNRYAIGIELVGPLQNGGFSAEQKESLKKLVKDISERNKIPIERILRHKDISPNRKTDVADSLWNKDFKSFEDFRANLFLENSEKTEYSDLYNSWINKGKKPIFNDLKGDRKMKELVSIGVWRNAEK